MHAFVWLVVISSYFLACVGNVSGEVAFFYNSIIKLIVINNLLCESLSYEGVEASNY